MINLDYTLEFKNLIPIKIPHGKRFDSRGLLQSRYELLKILQKSRILSNRFVDL